MKRRITITSTSSTATSSSSTDQTTLSIASLSSSITLTCDDPSYDLLRRRFEQKNTKIQTLEKQNLSLELDKADLILKTKELKRQKQDVIYEIAVLRKDHKKEVERLNEETKTLREHAEQLRNDNKAIKKKFAKEFATKNKLHAQLTRAIITLQAVESTELKLENENAELLLANAAYRMRNCRLVKLVDRESSQKNSNQRELMRAAEKQMDTVHKVKSLEYELRVWREAGRKKVPAAVVLRKTKKRIVVFGFDLRGAVKLTCPLGVLKRRRWW